METPDQLRLNLKGLIEKLRTVTLAVQLMPFIYDSCYLVVLALYLFADEKTLEVLDTLFYVSPVMVIHFLILSRLLKLCKWHKMACALPVIPQASVLAERFFVTFSEDAVRAHLAITLLLTVSLLISTYNVFFTNKAIRRRKAIDRCP